MQQAVLDLLPSVTSGTLLLNPLMCFSLILFPFHPPWREVVTFVNFVLLYYFAFQFFIT